MANLKLLRTYTIIDKLQFGEETPRIYTYECDCCEQEFEWPEIATDPKPSYCPMCGEEIENKAT